MDKSETYWTVFRATVATAIQEGSMLLRGLLPETRMRINQQFGASPAGNATQIPIMRSALTLLDDNQEQWVQVFPAHLLETFTEVAEFDLFGSGNGTLSELGDFGDSQSIQAKSEIWHLLKTLESALETPLNDLDGLVSAARGYTWSKPARNPLRPANYFAALQQLVHAAPAEPAARQYLLKQLATGLVPLLSRTYQLATRLLSEAGINAVQRRSTGFGSLNSGFGNLTPQKPDADDRLLTKDELFEALDNNAQLQLRANPPASAGKQPPPPPLTTIANTASLDVDIHWSPSTSDTVHPLQDSAAPGEVTLDQLVIRLARATSHLPPLKETIAKLQPGLRSLVQNDPAFLRSVNHPARRLISGIEVLAGSFQNTSAAGFDTFAQTVQQIGNSLYRTSIQDSAPFVRALEVFNNRFQPSSAEPDSPPGTANAASTQADKSSPSKPSSTQLLAEVTAHIRQHPDFATAPPRVQKFASEVWAKVIVKTHLTHLHATNSQTPWTDDPQGALAVVPLLLASVQAVKLRQPNAELLEAINPIWEKIKQGLLHVGLDVKKSAAAVSKLQQMHKVALEEASAESNLLEDLDLFLSAPTNYFVDLTDDGSVPAAMLAPAPAQPAEAPAVDAANGNNTPPLPSTEELPTPASEPPPPAATAAALPAAKAPQLDDLLLLGSWFTFGTEQPPLKSKLSWVSEENNVFMFTSEDGSNQTMTRRRLLKLFESGHFRPN